MNRSNVGNVITNGMQILSVGATTASGLIRHNADQRLNNQMNEMRQDYMQSQIDKTKAQTSKLKAQASDIRQQTKQRKLEVKSPQSENINTRVNSDLDYTKRVQESAKHYAENIVNKGLMEVNKV